MFHDETINNLHTRADGFIPCRGTEARQVVHRGIISLHSPFHIKQETTESWVINLQEQGSDQKLCLLPVRPTTCSIFLFCLCKHLSPLLLLSMLYKGPPIRPSLASGGHKWNIRDVIVAQGWIWQNSWHTTTDFYRFLYFKSSSNFYTPCILVPWYHGAQLDTQGRLSWQNNGRG